MGYAPLRDLTFFVILFGVFLLHLATPIKGCEARFRMR